MIQPPRAGMRLLSKVSEQAERREAMNELLIKDGLVIPMVGGARVLRNKSIVVAKNRIREIGATVELVKKYPQAHILDASHHAVLPGIVNAHTHVVPTIMLRGLTEDRLDSFYGLAPSMKEAVTPETVYAMSKLGCAEAIAAGSTCIAEIWHHMEQTACAVDETGLRGVLAHKVKDVDLVKARHDRYEFDSREGEARLAVNVDLVNKWHKGAGGRITCRIGTHAADTVSPALLKKARAAADELGVGIHIHVAQSAEEVAHIQEVAGKGPVEYLADLGFLDDRVLAAHLVYVSDREIGILKETGTYMAHCPAIMAKRARFAPVGKIYAAGVRVALGNDWVNMDPWDNMRMAIAGARITTGIVGVLSPYQVLQMATSKAAEALGLKKEIGTLEAGKKADIILIDLVSPHFYPRHERFDLISTLVYNATGNDVSTVIIDGKIIMEDREFISLDLEDVMRDAETASQRLWRRVVEKRKDRAGPAADAASS
jgi:5-methylthioadenosine/S-adenosylhomocysteine deaminase